MSEMASKTQSAETGFHMELSELYTRGGEPSSQAEEKIYKALQKMYDIVLGLEFHPLSTKVTIVINFQKGWVKTAEDQWIETNPNPGGLILRS